MTHVLVPLPPMWECWRRLLARAVLSAVLLGRKPAVGGGFVKVPSLVLVLVVHVIDGIPKSVSTQLLALKGIGICC